MAVNLNAVVVRARRESDRAALGFEEIDLVQLGELIAAVLVDGKVRETPLPTRTLRYGVPKRRVKTTQADSRSPPSAIELKLADASWASTTRRHPICSPNAPAVRMSRPRKPNVPLVVVARPLGLLAVGATGCSVFELNS